MTQSDMTDLRDAQNEAAILTVKVARAEKQVADMARRHEAAFEAMTKAHKSEIARKQLRVDQAEAHAATITETCNKEINTLRAKLKRKADEIAELQAAVKAAKAEARKASAAKESVKPVPTPRPDPGLKKEVERHRAAAEAAQAEIKSLRRVIARTPEPPEPKVITICERDPADIAEIERLRAMVGEAE